MRTTVTLEPDVAVLVQRVMRERRLTFKEAVNDALRAALRPRVDRAGPRTPTFPMRLRDGVDLTKSMQLASDLEDDSLLAKMREGR
jgi:hypothetical protein